MNTILDYVAKLLPMLVPLAILAVLCILYALHKPA